MTAQGSARVVEEDWESPSELDPAAILRLLLRYKWLIIAISLACAISAERTTSSVTGLTAAAISGAPDLDDDGSRRVHARAVSGMQDGGGHRLLDYRWAVDHLIGG